MGTYKDDHPGGRSGAKISPASLTQNRAHSSKV